jgi:hypothetical protein
MQVHGKDYEQMRMNEAGYIRTTLYHIKRAKQIISIHENSSEMMKKQQMMQLAMSDVVGIRT